MSGPDRNIDGEPQPTVLWTDAIRESFDSEWQAGRRPRMEESLTETSGKHRDVLLRELLSVEIRYRHQWGGHLSAADDEQRFRTARDEVNQLLAEMPTLHPGDEALKSTVSHAPPARVARATPSFPNGVWERGQ